MKPKAATAVVLLSLLIAHIAALASPAASNAVENNASGSGLLTVNGEKRTFSFTAIRYSDGTAHGQAQVKNRSLDVRVHLEIDCLRVVGNIAHMSGVVTATSDPTVAELGERSRFAVQDNGEGGGAPTDLITTIPRNPDLETCENNTLVPSRRIEAGNINVR